MADIYPSGYESQRQLLTKTGDGLDQAVMSGYALFSMVGGQDGNWNRQDLILRVGPQWASVRGTVPVVSPSSMMNRHIAVNAGWAVDRVKVTYYQLVPGPLGVQVSLRCGLAVRDTDGYMFRVNYYVTTVGEFVNADDLAAESVLVPAAELLLAQGEDLDT